MAITTAQPLVDALRNKLQITIVYTKKTNGETVIHTGGIYEINSAEGRLWLWDTARADTIRQFYISLIQSFEVLQIPFQTNGVWPLKLDGQILGY